MIPFLERTWGKDQRVNTIFYQGGENRSFMKKNILKLNVPSSQESVHEKGFKAFEWALDNLDFDVVYRCTTTTYLNIDNLLSFLKDKEMNNFLCGVHLTFPHHEVPEDEKITFISGAGCFFSRDVVEKLIDNKNLYDFSLNDDVAIGKLLIGQLKIKPEEGFYQDFLFGYPLYKDIDFNNYHFRFKLGSDAFKPYYPRYLEVITLLSLHLRRKVRNNLIGTFFFYIADRVLWMFYNFLRIINPNFIIYMLNNFYLYFKKNSIKLIKKILNK